MAIKRSKSSELYYTQYKNSKKAETNRKKKLEKQLKLQPNNAEQIKKAIANASYRRKTPKTSVWDATSRAAAILMKRFVGKFDKNVLSSDFEIQAAAARVRKEVWFVSKKVPNQAKTSMFALAARAHDGRGNLIWAQ